MLALLLMAAIQAGAEPAADSQLVLAGSLLDRLERHVVSATTMEVNAMTLTMSTCAPSGRDLDLIAVCSNSVMWKAGRVHRQVGLSALGEPSRFFLTDFGSDLSARFFLPGPDRPSFIEVENLGSPQSEDFGWRISQFDTMQRYLRSMRASLLEKDIQLKALSNSFSIIVPYDTKHPRDSSLGVPGNNAFLAEGTFIHYSLELLSLEEDGDWWSLTVQLTGQASAVVRSSFFSGIGHQGLPYRASHVIDFERSGSMVLLSRYHQANLANPDTCDKFVSSFDQFKGAMVRDRRLPDGHLAEYPFSGSFPSMAELRKLK